jgi:N-acetylated-alpha-linked acidic dipeptidase
MPRQRSPLARALVTSLTVVVFSLTTQAAQEPAARPEAKKTLLGFTAAGSEKQRALEAQFDGSLSGENLKTWQKRLSARPHHVGSPYDKDNAEFIAGLFKSWGYDTTIESFDVLFPTPTVRVLEMVGPEKVIARLAEPTLREDATSGQTREQLPVYNAYSIDGDVTGDLVYVNYGIPRDYEILAEHGIDVKGKIVLARYGGSWRGIKPKVAAEHGAIGCLIYSDPRDDGYFQGDTYPKGPFRNEYGAQRGSVADMPVFPGDPLTPGIGATKDAKRLPREQAPTLTKIPVMPISYGDALPLLKAMTGPVAPLAWRGALPVTYHLGPGATKVHLKLAFDWSLKPLYDVIARMPGSERPDEWIIRGNHHDAWVNGADDPLSGMVVVLEEARALAQLAKSGWKPKRTVIYTAWDGEEPGLLGSTEWVETHAADLQQHAVAYVNSDSNARGFLGVGGSHSLEAFVGQVARDVTDPEKNVTVFERARAVQIVRGTAEEAKEARARPDLRINALGSGSDYTPFLQHLGIASLDIGFGGEGQGGSYHSIFDSYDHFQRFVDPDNIYGVVLAKTGGRVVLRLANADVVPLQFGAFSETVGRYVKEVTKLVDDLREETTETNRRLADHTLQEVADPKLTYVAPAPKDPVPFLNLSPIQNALARLQEKTKAYDEALQKSFAAGSGVPAGAQQQLDTILIQSERVLTTEQGLPRRPWFKHAIYAPGFYTGYGVKTLPGVREAIEQRAWKEAEQQAVTIGEALDRLSTQLQRGIDLLGGSNPATK